MDGPTIRLSSSLTDAIDAMQADVDRGAVVLDERDHVIGILTEGDIVRAMRRGVLTESRVEDVMTGQVRLTTEPLDPQALAFEFSVHGTLLVPVVDSSRRLLYVQRAREAVGQLLSLGQNPV